MKNLNIRTRREKKAKKNRICSSYPITKTFKVLLIMCIGQLDKEQLNIRRVKFKKNRICSQYPITKKLSKN